MEETGFDISPLIEANEYAEEILRGEQRNRLFIIPNVSEQTLFCPQTRKEISVRDSLLYQSQETIFIFQYCYLHFDNYSFNNIIIHSHNNHTLSYHSA
jgi:hypothetical protein